MQTIFFLLSDSTVEYPELSICMLSNVPTGCVLFIFKRHFLLVASSKLTQKSNQGLALKNKTCLSSLWYASQPLFSSSILPTLCLSCRLAPTSRLSISLSPAVSVVVSVLLWQISRPICSSASNK